MAGTNAERAATALADSLIAKGYTKAEHRAEVIAIQTEVISAILNELKNYAEIYDIEYDEYEGQIGTGRIR